MEVLSPHAQRQLARGILAGLVGLLVALVLFGSSSIRNFAFGQATASATPTPTPAIKLLNPDDDTSNEVSTKPDANNTYHLNSFSVNLPPNTVVTYWLDEGDSDTVFGRIGVATRLPDSNGDTWEYHWDGTVEAGGATPNPGGTRTAVPDGEYTLRVVAEDEPERVLASDEELIDFNSRTDPTAGDVVAPAETVEITSPTNAGPLGVFTTGGSGSASTFVITGTASAATTFVRGFYTLSAPGQEPVWTSCTQNYVAATDLDPNAPEDQVSYRCTMAAADTGKLPTAVALVPNDAATQTPADARPGFNESADAHRTFSYSQEPTTVTLNPVTSQANQNACQSVTGTVLDQQGRPVTTANVDIHAVGPGEGTRFDVGTGSDTSKAPDQGQHTADAAYNCGTNTVAGNNTQGAHIDPVGPDRKHIESVTGTDNNGNFKFALRSTVIGTTQFTFWADTDQNDRLCATEAQAHGSIGFGAAAAAPAPAAAEDATCSTRPQSTASPSGTATARPTTTATPSGSATASSTASASPSASASPTEDPDPDPRGCTILGTSGDDTLEGTAREDVICGLGGDDLIVGRGGADLIYGDSGADALRGGGANDTVRGGGGDDALKGGGGNDRLRGNGGTDLLLGGGGNDNLKGGASKDTLKGGRGRDLLDGGAGRDRCAGGPGKDRLRRCER